MKKLLLLSLGAFALAGCAPMMGMGMYTFSPQPSAPSGIVPVGTASIGESAGMTSTVIKLSGLAANTPYVAHYHNMGIDSTSPCASNGSAIMESKMVGVTDAGGTLTLSGSVADAALMDATYLNVHTASDTAGTPADPGVACTPVMVKK
ncbi:superoxide dismutase [Deinococcus sp. KNUC1210]|uniref:superoxide dismutase n=1 Tax=Deinococcus sp. KNUC1210 TaxID=2917691 RepID=UPI001EF09E92|nr:superoxide dismutase [Deinococcus sp. KNUC1210]ULH15727.1 superoxide dismutase [Deinococcus sp. KNUC1210]